MRKGLIYEQKRQAQVLVQVVKFNKKLAVTMNQLQKQFDACQRRGHQDYRYFPEPDLPLYEVSDEWIEEMRQTLPEFPKERRAKYINEFGLTAYDAAQLTANKSNF